MTTDPTLGELLAQAFTEETEPSEYIFAFQDGEVSLDGHYDFNKIIARYEELKKEHNK